MINESIRRGPLSKVREVCLIFCATSNPVAMVAARSDQGSGVLGVIDDSAPKGVETPADVAVRKELLWKFGCKL